MTKREPVNSTVALCAAGRKKSDRGENKLPSTVISDCGAPVRTFDSGDDRDGPSGDDQEWQLGGYGVLGTGTRRTFVGQDNVPRDLDGYCVLGLFGRPGEG
jgi:hypothetical protein